ncbi:transposase IS116/IS110/IS902 family protein [Rhodanobacter denitrificans]|nr:transposase IS116/IS110/IS902 family protein [Rhodanobacter denitrificans]
MAQVAAGAVVAMEACSGAHRWARRCLGCGLRPRIVAAQFVKPFRKSSRSKNDHNDAEAVATAARQGNMRFVPVKSLDQQARLSWHRVREGCKAESLAVGNRIRGPLAEFGVIVAQSDMALRRLPGDLDAQSGLPAKSKELRDLAEHWKQLRLHLDACNARIEAHAREDEWCMRLRAITGIGPITADAAVATIGNARESRIGRWRPGWAWCPPSTPVAGMRDCPPSDAGVKRRAASRASAWTNSQPG